jgi:hypothetical protein
MHFIVFAGVVSLLQPHTLKGQFTVFAGSRFPVRACRELQLVRGAQAWAGRRALRRRGPAGGMPVLRPFLRARRAARGWAAGSHTELRLYHRLFAVRVVGVAGPGSGSASQAVAVVGSMRSGQQGPAWSGLRQACAARRRAGANARLPHQPWTLRQCTGAPGRVAATRECCAAEEV